MVDNSVNEAHLVARGQVTANAFVRGLSIKPDHQVLEEGYGVARIGRELAPYCREWRGCDISSSMIKIARRRTPYLDNGQLLALPS